MTKEEAIIHLTEARKYPVAYTLEEQEAYEMAISALREQEEYESLKNSYAQLQASFDQIYESNMAMGVVIKSLREQCVLDATKTSGWISVEERLPKEFVSVLVYMPEERPLPTVHEGFLAREGVWYANHFDREPMEITHWMPLPEAPKEE